MKPISVIIKKIKDFYSNGLKKFRNIPLKFHKEKFNVGGFSITYIHIFAVVFLFFVFLFVLGSKFTGFVIQADSSSKNLETAPVVYRPPSGPTGANINPSPTNPSSQTQQIAQIAQNVNEPPPNFQGLASVLSNTQIVKDFPDGVETSLNFFTFTNGNRVWQNTYTVKKGQVITDSSGNAEVKVIIHSKYVNRIYGEDFCSVLRDANKNGDLGYETSLNSVSLAWKFKSLLKYKNCLS